MIGDASTSKTLATPRSSIALTRLYSTLCADLPGGEPVTIPETTFLLRATIGRAPLRWASRWNFEPSLQDIPGNRISADEQDR
jgi:hypothetical protein